MQQKNGGITVANRGTRKKQKKCMHILYIKRTSNENYIHAQCILYPKCSGMACKRCNLANIWNNAEFQTYNQVEIEGCMKVKAKNI